MADIAFVRTQILDNCSILFPHPVSPTLLTFSNVVRGVDAASRKILVVCANTSQLLLQQDGTGLEEFRSLLATTERKLSSHAEAILRGEGPASRNPERSRPSIFANDTTAKLQQLKELQKLKEECVALRDEKDDLQQRLKEALAANDKLQERLDKSIASREEALRMVQTSNSSHADMLQMAQRQMERLWTTQHRHRSTSEARTDDTGTTRATPIPTPTSFEFSRSSLF
jgi:myosin heavy subunit